MSQPAGFRSKGRGKSRQVYPVYSGGRADGAGGKYPHGTASTRSMVLVGTVSQSEAILASKASDSEKLVSLQAMGWKVDDEYRVGSAQEKGLWVTTPAGGRCFVYKSVGGDTRLGAVEFVILALRSYIDHPDWPRPKYANVGYGEK